MRSHVILFAVILAELLSGCVLPVQRVSPDPTAALPQSTLPLIQDPSVSSEDYSVTMPAPETPRTSDPSDSGLSAITEPKLALFWYAMADAHVYDMRDAFTPLLDDADIQYREYDAENDRYRQLDQIREAVSSGWNVLAVQPVAPDSVEAVTEIILAAEGHPVILFDRTPDPGLCTDCSWAQLTSVCQIRTSPNDSGRVQGRMIGQYLLSHYDTADLDLNGQIRYTMLAGSADDPTALILSRTAVEEANAVLADAGYRPLAYFDEENSLGFQADPSGQGSSDSAHAMISSDLNDYNYANSNMIELIAANNDDMALGALTALQASWCNLGDGSSVTIPLFGIGAVTGARSAVSLGQMTGTVDFNSAAYARAIISLVRGFSSGRPAAEVCADMAVSDEYAVQDGFSAVLCVIPVPVLF